jgi:hypothetical protein
VCKASKRKKDKQRGADIETLGRNFIVGELLRAGLNCAVPIWDTGVDVIAWAGGSTTFVPLQLKTTLGQLSPKWCVDVTAGDENQNRYSPASATGDTLDLQQIVRNATNRVHRHRITLSPLQGT